MNVRPGRVTGMLLALAANSIPFAAVVAVTVTSGCATALVRSDCTTDPKHVFPATTVDGEFFWHCGIRGEPVLARADSTPGNGLAYRIACGVGAIIDLPFSVAFDAILVPVDLTRSGAAAGDLSAKGAPGGSANGSQAPHSETNRPPTAPLL